MLLCPEYSVFLGDRGASPAFFKNEIFFGLKFFTWSLTKYLVQIRSAVDTVSVDILKISHFFLIFKAKGASSKYLITTFFNI